MSAHPATPMTQASAKNAKTRRAGTPIVRRQGLSSAGEVCIDYLGRIVNWKVASGPCGCRPQSISFSISAIGTWKELPGNSNNVAGISLPSENLKYDGFFGSTTQIA